MSKPRKRKGRKPKSPATKFAEAWLEVNDSISGKLNQKQTSTGMTAQQVADFLTALSRVGISAKHTEDAFNTMLYVNQKEHHDYEYRPRDTFVCSGADDTMFLCSGVRSYPDNTYSTPVARARYEPKEFAPTGWQKPIPRKQCVFPDCREIAALNEVYCKFHMPIRTHAICAPKPPPNITIGESPRVRFGDLGKKIVSFVSGKKQVIEDWYKRAHCKHAEWEPFSELPEGWRSKPGMQVHLVCAECGEERVTSSAFFTSYPHSLVRPMDKEFVQKEADKMLNLTVSG